MPKGSNAGRPSNVSKQLREAKSAVAELTELVTTAYKQAGAFLPQLIEAELVTGLEFEDKNSPIQAAKIRQKSRQFIIGMLAAGTQVREEDYEVVRAMMREWGGSPGARAELTERKAVLTIDEQSVASPSEGHTQDP
jgi:hypothetical protein